MRGILKFTNSEMAVCQPSVSPGEPCWAALLDAQGQAVPTGTVCMTKGVAVRLCGHKHGLDAFFKGMWEKGQGRGW